MMKLDIRHHRSRVPSRCYPIAPAVAHAHLCLAVSVVCSSLKSTQASWRIQTIYSLSLVLASRVRPSSRSGQLLSSSFPFWFIRTRRRYDGHRWGLYCPKHITLFRANSSLVDD